MLTLTPDVVLKHQALQNPEGLYQTSLPGKNHQKIIQDFVEEFGGSLSEGLGDALSVEEDEEGDASTHHLFAELSRQHRGKMLLESGVLKPLLQELAKGFEAKHGCEH